MKVTQFFALTVLGGMSLLVGCSSLESTIDQSSGLVEQAAKATGMETEFSPTTQLLVTGFQEAHLNAELKTLEGYAKALGALGADEDADKASAAADLLKNTPFASLSLDDYKKASSAMGLASDTLGDKLASATVEKDAQKTLSESLLDMATGGKLNSMGMKICQKATGQIKEEVKAEPGRAAQADELYDLGEYMMGDVPGQIASVTKNIQLLAKVAHMAGASPATQKQIDSAIKTIAPKAVEAEKELEK